MYSVPTRQQAPHTAVRHRGSAVFCSHLNVVIINVYLFKVAGQQRGPPTRLRGAPIPQEWGTGLHLAEPNVLINVKARGPWA